MSDRLEGLIASARASDLDTASTWDVDRSERVRAGVLRRHDVRARRDRLMRRGLLVAGGAGLLVLALLRAASSAPAEPIAGAASALRELAPVTTPAPAPTAEQLAARSMALADAGYARD